MHLSIGVLVEAGGEGRVGGLSIDLLVVVGCPGAGVPLS